MDINLNFINHSNDNANSQIIIFQKNVSNSYGELAHAWRVIKNCGQGDYHPFTYPMEMQVSASDSWGNYTPQFACTNGDLFEMSNDGSGDVLRKNGRASSVTEVQVLNSLDTGAIGANIFKGGKLLAAKTSVSPDEMATFQFKPTLWIGVASGIQEGQVINSAVMSRINTEFSLLGLASADIVMTGGGGGQNATAFQFSLQNIVMA